jgi:hypothetical protein
LPETTVYTAEQLPESTPRPLGLGDARSSRILAKTIYRELRASGLDEREVLALASELLGLVAAEVRNAEGD